MRVERTTKAAVLASTLTVAGLVSAATAAPSASGGGDQTTVRTASTVQVDGALDSYLNQRERALELERASRAVARDAERAKRAERAKQAEKARRLKAKKKRERAAKRAAAREAAAKRAAQARREAARKAAAERKARAARAARQSARPSLSARSSGAGSGRNWAALARCESSGRPGAVSSNGQYHGLYQFSVSTWRSVGGSGLPSQASAAEQTRRAQLLYKSRGAQPWPRCGRYL